MNLVEILLITVNILVLAFGFLARRAVRLQDEFNKTIDERMRIVETHGCAFCQVQYPTKG